MFQQLAGSSRWMGAAGVSIEALSSSRGRCYEMDPCSAAAGLECRRATALCPLPLNPAAVVLLCIPPLFFSALCVCVCAPVSTTAAGKKSNDKIIR